MTYPRRPSRPSASMLHEMRMIAQSFFSHRTTASVLGRQPESNPLFCVPCFRNGKRNKAFAIEGGQSVCMAHIF